MHAFTVRWQPTFSPHGDPPEKRTELLDTPPEADGGSLPPLWIALLRDLRLGCGPPEGPDCSWSKPEEELTAEPCLHEAGTVVVKAGGAHGRTLPA